MSSSRGIRSKRNRPRKRGKRKRTRELEAAGSYQELVSADTSHDAGLEKQSRIEVDEVLQLISFAGRRVREMRQSKSWTQNELAEKSGVLPRYISEIERGALLVPVSIVGKVAQALGLNASYVESSLEFSLKSFSEPELRPL